MLRVVSETSLGFLRVETLVRTGNSFIVTPTIQYGVKTYFLEMPRLRVPARKVESFYTLVSECVNSDNQGIS